jgi:hypothetical protein
MYRPPICRPSRRNMQPGCAAHATQANISIPVQCDCFLPGPSDVSTPVRVVKIAGTVRETGPPYRSRTSDRDAFSIGAAQT